MHVYLCIDVNDRPKDIEISMNEPMMREITIEDYDGNLMKISMSEPGSSKSKDVLRNIAVLLDVNLNYLDRIYVNVVYCNECI